MDIEFWKKVFRYGAYWNWFFTITGIFMPGFTRKILGLDAGEGTALFQAGFFGAVGLFGLMYYWVSLDPMAGSSRKFVILGIIGKLMVFFLFAYYFFNELIILPGFMPAVGDLIFTFFFATFLVVAGKAGSPT